MTDGDATDPPPNTPPSDPLEATRVDRTPPTPGLPIPEDYASMEVPGYKLISLLGQGGMGVVFLAQQERLERLVAIKMLSKEMSQDAEYVQRLRREAVTLGNMNHPNIVGCHDVLVHAGKTYFVMEYVPGKTSVRDLIRRYGHLSEVTSLRILLQAARGLAYANEKGIIHRDVKPENLQVFTDLDATADGPDVLIGAPETRIMLLDFGLAKGVTDKTFGDNIEITGRGFVVGSPSYMAPEQAVADPVDFRADVYALGASLYHMLTGITPFASDSPMQSLNRKLVEDLPDPNENGVEVSAECVALLHEMTARDLEHRPASYRVLIERIEQILALHGAMPGSSARLATPPKRPSGKRRGPWLAAAILAVCLIAVLALVLRPKPATSLTADSSLWTVNGDAWQFAEPDEESIGQIALIGGGRDAIAGLDQPIPVPSRITLDLRIPGNGTVAIGLGTDSHETWRLAFTRKGDIETYELTIDGEQVKLPALRSRKNWEWRHLEISIYPESIVFYVDGALSGSQNITSPPSTYHLTLNVTDARIAQFADLIVAQ